MSEFPFIDRIFRDINNSLVLATSLLSKLSITQFFLSLQDTTYNISPPDFLSFSRNLISLQSTSNKLVGRSSLARLFHEANDTLLLFNRFQVFTPLCISVGNVAADNQALFSLFRQGLPGASADYLSLEVRNIHSKLNLQHPVCSDGVVPFGHTDKTNLLSLDVASPKVRKIEAISCQTVQAIDNQVVLWSEFI